MIRGSRWGGGGERGLFQGLPWKNHKTIGFFRNTGPDSLGHHKATKTAFNVGTAKRHLNGVSLVARF